MHECNGRGPDFIIIGAMKSATSTLQEQLSAQVGIFMSSPKEPNYFSDEREFSRGLDWYSALFSGAVSPEIIGEASTHYTKLPTYPKTVRRMKHYLPELRLVYVMRHPIDRLISHYIHEWSMGKIRCGINKAVERYPEMIAYGQYTMQLEPYFCAYGKAAVLPVFFDRLTCQPQRELERVCKFIGYQHQPKWRSELGPKNTSSERIRRFPFSDTLINSQYSIMLRRIFVPSAWRNSIKSSLQMHDRPELAPIVSAELESIFDKDLAKLGELLGHPMSCENFKSITTNSELNWVFDNE